MTMLRPSCRSLYCAGARTRQRGVALAIVVWFIAAMGLLVGGMVYQAKLETRAAQMHLAQAKVAAAGDGAIQLGLANLVSRDGTENGQRFRLGDLEAVVFLTPTVGLIDLNRAPRELLVNLFSAVAIPRGDAEILADNVIQWRSPSLAGPGQRIDSIESLLAIDGFDRVRIDAMRDLVSSGLSGAGFFSAKHAPEAVRKIVSMQEPGADNKPDGARRGERAAPQRADAYRVDAMIDYGGRRWLRRRWVRMGSAAHSELPWRFTRTEPPRVLRQ